MNREVTLIDVGCGMAGLLAGVQLMTEADPIGKSMRFLKQLQGHVSSCRAPVVLFLIVLFRAVLARKSSWRYGIMIILLHFYFVPLFSKSVFHSNSHCNVLRTHLPLFFRFDALQCYHAVQFLVAFFHL
jgi:hypothetical protein